MHSTDDLIAIQGWTTKQSKLEETKINPLAGAVTAGRVKGAEAAQANNFSMLISS
jgi:hypothetical protein